ncbi:MULTISPECIES: ABC transporter permease [Methylorubrum]|jgi:NitT/TauT family transport system permease protein|uniref:Permease component of ABC transporter n=2 Tax=Methylorubrum extorquens TaxID=408 RepID=C5B0E4_METEA|nr:MULTISPECIES: ABC transporter permease [Methylorubrum]ACS39494.1 putative permease component of ABC transporter [Methylorubrum extorquens AM1]EHP90693.1 ABC-type transporter, integral membrane subunit [Methylorubrum extorquens DSM 13060]MCP1542389.1 NitT/TauT family transport system permease protein [Methylorubrum extorquens]MCP1590266.1 NitT/TauT family transport system permease protein [Methylorubrum extorquens]UYW28027.1 ABC transporter permease [Methylorubrum extorquens]
MRRPLIQDPRVQAALPPLLVGLAVLSLWEAACRGFAVPEYLFPAPSVIAASLVQNGPDLLRALWSTMRVTLIAFALSTVLGTLVAFLFVQSRFIERGFFPYAVMLQVTPVVAVAPLIIILVRDTQVALVICATIIAIFPMISNTTVGLRSVDPGLVNLMRVYRASRLQTLLRLRIPSALGYFFAGLRISSGLALIGAVVAEFVAGTGGRSAGLAYEILQAGFQLDIPRMFAALSLITAAGILLFLAMSGLSRLALGSWGDPERA